MTISIQSTSDSPEAVTAALGDLAPKPVVDEPKVEPVTEVDPKPGEESEVEEVTEVIEVPTDEESEDESEELEAKENETKEKPKKIGGFQKKIAKLKQETEYWKEQALRTQAPAKVEPPAKVQDQSLRPKPTDFATHDDYVEALVDWKAEAKMQAAKQKDREEKIKTEVQAKFNTHQQRVTAFKETHEDFDDALENVSTIPMSLAVQESILESDVGPQMMYALAKDPKEFKRLCSLPPLQAAREIGKLEAKFSKTTSTTSSVTTTRAPKPVTPVRTRGATSVKDISDPNISQREFERLREEQIKQNSMRR